MADGISTSIYTAHPLTSLATIQASGSPHKIVHLIRHAQGTHNLAVLESGGADGGHGDKEEEYKNWKWHDARLTPLGEDQAKTLQDTLAGVHIDIVLVSCLSRAIQTGLIGIPAGPPFVAFELIRERIGTHPCDKRRSRDALTADFPSVDFGGLATAEDSEWTEEREPMEALVGRADAFLDAIAARPEASIAAVSHNDFLTALLFDSSLRLADSSLRRKFKNAEHMAIVLTWESHPTRQRGPSLSRGQIAVGQYGSHGALDLLVRLEAPQAAAASGSAKPEARPSPLSTQ